MIPPTLRVGDRIHGYNANEDNWHVVEGLTHVFVPRDDTVEVGDVGWETAWGDQHSDRFPQAAVWVLGREAGEEKAQVWAMWEKTYAMYATLDLLSPFVIGLDDGR